MSNKNIRGRQLICIFHPIFGITHHESNDLIFWEVSSIVLQMIQITELKRKKVERCGPPTQDHFLALKKLPTKLECYFRE